MTKASRAKGGLAEKLAVQELEDRGYLCEKPVRSKWQREDFFGCWDIIAVKQKHTKPCKNCPDEVRIRFIQVSTKPLYDRGIEYKKKLADFPSSEFWTKEFWQLKEGGEWRVWRI